jgi:hypothetical protein
MSSLNVYSTEYLREKDVPTMGMKAASYAFIVWVNTPDWFKDDELMKDFVEKSQTKFKAFEGFRDIEISGDFDFNDTVELDDEPNHITLTHKDNLDMEIFNLYTRWYKNQTLDDDAKLLYIMARPEVDETGAKYVVEFAAGYEILGFKSIETHIDCIDMDDNTAIEFQSSMTIDSEIEEFAQKIVDDKFNKGDTE